MTLLHATIPFNVEASLNAWIQTQLTAITTPSWLSSFSVVFNIPETGIVTPAISVFHLPVMIEDLYQGRQVGSNSVGVKVHAMMDVSPWVSRATPNWMAQLSTLNSMIYQVFTGTSQVVINDYTTPVTPAVTSYKVNLTGIETTGTIDDLNPDIERRRFLINYHWIQRSN